MPILNYVNNPFFCDVPPEGDEEDGDYQHPGGENMFVPIMWDIDWVDGEPFEGIAIDPPGLVAHRPECNRISRYHLPDQPELFGDTTWIWKIFVRNPVKFSIFPQVPHRPQLPAGTYFLNVRVWPKLHLLGEDNLHPDDPWAGEIGLSVDNHEDVLWYNGEHLNLYSEYATLTWEIDHPGGEVDFRIHAKGKYPIDNTFFFDEVWIYPAEGSPGEPLPGGIVELGPNTMTVLERIAEAVEALSFNDGEPAPPNQESGYPRIAYDKTCVLFHPEHTPKSLRHALIDAMDNLGITWTLTPSADDSAMGPGLTPHVIVLNPADWGGQAALADFFNTYYPDASYEWILATTPEDVISEFQRRFGPEIPDAFPVTLFSQRNPAWAGDYLGTSGLTIGGAGCAMASVAMAGTAVETALTPKILNQRLSANGGYTSGGLLYWAIAGEQIPGLDYLTYRTWRTSPKPPADVPAIKAALARGEFVVVQVDFVPHTSALDTHFVLVLSDLGDDLLVADPWTGERIRLLERYGKGDLEQSIYAAAFYRKSTFPPAPEKSVRGVHAPPITKIADAEDVERFISERILPLGLSWFKMLDSTDSDPAHNLTFAQALISHGIKPVIRLYFGEILPDGPSDDLMSRARSFLNIGVEYFEVLNEPNVPWEWQPGYVVDYHHPDTIRLIGDLWFDRSMRLVAQGAKVGFPAMAPTERPNPEDTHGSHPTYSSIQWTRHLLTYLADHHGPQLRSYVNAGQVWLSNHSGPMDKPLNWNPLRSWGWSDWCARGYEGHQAAFVEILGSRTPDTLITETGPVSPKHLQDFNVPSPYTWEEWGQVVKDYFDFLQGRVMGAMPWHLTDEYVVDIKWQDCGWYTRDGNERSPAQVLKE